MSNDRKELAEWVEAQFEAHSHNQAVAKLALQAGFKALDELSALGLHFEFYPREGPVTAEVTLPGQGVAHATWEAGLAGMYKNLSGDHHGLVAPGHQSPFAKPPLPVAPAPAPERSILELEAERLDPSLTGPGEPAGEEFNPAEEETH